MGVTDWIPDDDFPCPATECCLFRRPPLPTNPRPSECAAADVSAEFSLPFDVAAANAGTDDDRMWVPGLVPGDRDELPCFARYLFRVLSSEARRQLFDAEGRRTLQQESTYALCRSPTLCAVDILAQTRS